MNYTTKLIRTTIVTVSLKTLLKGQLRFMYEKGAVAVEVSGEGKELYDVHENEKGPLP